MADNTGNLEPDRTTISRERRMEMALDSIRNMALGSMEDLDQMKRWHPPSKRGSNYTRFLESLEGRLCVLLQEAEGALQ